MATAGRKSKLTDKQWAEVEKRVLLGESLRIVAKSYGVTEFALRNHGITSLVKRDKLVANQLVTAEENLRALPIESQLLTLDLAASLRSISKHLAAAANNGAATAHRLSNYAHSYTEMIDDNAPLAVNEEALKAVEKFQDIANKAAQLGVSLLAANKENSTLNTVENTVVSAEQIPSDPIEASRAYQRIMQGK